MPPYVPARLRSHDIEALTSLLYLVAMAAPTIKPPKRNKRLGMIALVGGGLAVGMALILTALNENTQFFYNPADVLAAEFVPQSERFKIG